MLYGAPLGAELKGTTEDIEDELNRNVIVYNGEFVQEIEKLRTIDKSYQIFRDRNCASRTILREIFEVSVCEGLSQQRKKMLYLDAFD